MRALIVNADDFGMSEAVNLGILRAHDQGVVTSTTLMVRRPAAQAAAALARSASRLSVGLHVDLGEWVYEEQGWRASYEVVDCTDQQAVAAEVDAQVAAFERLLGRPPTHLDSHQHVHRTEPVASVVRDVGRRLGVRVRHEAPDVAYRGDFYGQTGKGEPYAQAITVEALLAVLDDLAAGVSELGCHPGESDEALDDVYRDERAVELAVLCDPRVRRGLAERDIALRSFAELDAPG